MHLNLPFRGDKEFSRLHAAVRLVLPLLPALAASSPFCEGRATSSLDHRLEVYRNNSRKVPACIGSVIPEPVFDREKYERLVLKPIYEGLAPLDASGTLLDEFSNARGAIARFGRGTIEIRLLDVQECPRADLAYAELIWRVLQALCAERWQPLPRQQSWSSETLAEILVATIKDVEHTMIQSEEFLANFGLGPTPITAGEVWLHVLAEVWPSDNDASGRRSDTAWLLRQGSLATRLRHAAGSAPDHAALVRLYRRLSDCLARGEFFESTAATKSKTS